MAKFSLLLYIGIALLMIDALIELSFLSSMVRWLNTGADGPYTIRLFGPDSPATYTLVAHPAHLEVNQGHTSNAAAGTAFVLVGTAGIIALFLRSRPFYATSRLAKFWYRAWLVLTVPSVLLTLAALIYVNVVTAQHAGQEINQFRAATLPTGTPYPLETWTPQGWFGAVLDLPLADAGVAASIRERVRVMDGWRWNLIPMLVLEIGVCVLAWLDARERKQGRISWDMKRDNTPYDHEGNKMI